MVTRGAGQAGSESRCGGGGLCDPCGTRLPGVESGAINTAAQQGCGTEDRVWPRASDSTHLGFIVTGARAHLNNRDFWLDPVLRDF